MWWLMVKPLARSLRCLTTWILIAVLISICYCCIFPSSPENLWWPCCSPYPVCPPLLNFQDLLLSGPTHWCRGNSPRSSQGLYIPELVLILTTLLTLFIQFPDPNLHPPSNHCRVTSFTHSATLGTEKMQFVHFVCGKAFSPANTPWLSGKRIILLLLWCWWSHSLKNLFWSDNPDSPFG